jgi:hypothetical protein
MQWFQDLLAWFAILFLVGSIVAAAAVLIFSTLAGFFMKNPNLPPPRPFQTTPSISNGDQDHPEE